ncbi:MAG: helix-turn-helix domain-containing protein [Myxococcota bacterium]
MADALPNETEVSLRRLEPVTAPDQEKADVIKLSEALDSFAAAKSTSTCKLIGPEGEELIIPESIFYLIERAAELFARGDAITLVPVGQELTTQQAANVLNVSRQYVVKLIDDGKLPHRKVNKHRKLLASDVLQFKRQRDKDRRLGLRNLSQITQSYGGYDAEVK